MESGVLIFSYFNVTKRNRLWCVGLIKSDVYIELGLGLPKPYT